MAESDFKVYSRLQVELLNGTPEDTRVFTGVSTSTTIRTFRAVVAARIGRAPKDVKLMAFGQALEDSSTLGDCRIDDDTILTRIVAAPTITPQPSPKPFDSWEPPKDAQPPRYNDIVGRRLNNVFIVDLSNKSNTLRDIPIQMKISEFIRLAARQLGENAGTMRLLYGSKQLREDSDLTLMDYDVGENSTFIMVDRIRGGSDSAYLSSLDGVSFC